MPRNRPLIFTALNSAGYLILGLMTSQRGPAFNDLLLISDTDVQGGSFYVMACYLGHMLGSIICGAIYGRIKTKTLVIGVMMTLSGVFTILIPWCSTFVAMLIIQCVASIFISAFDTTILSEEVQAWEGSSESAMQFLSFCYSLGGAFAPLITEPFLAPKTTNNNDSSVDSFTTISSNLENRIFLLNNESLKATSPALNRVICADNVLVNCSNLIEDYSLDNAMINTSLDLHNGNITLSNDVNSNLHFAYLITGALCISVAVAFYGASIKSYRKQTPKRQEVKVELASRKLPRKIYVGVLATMSSFYFFYTMVFFSFNQFAFFFVITHFNWSKENGAYLMSMYWALAMCSKLSLIAIYKCIDAGIVLLFSVSGIVISVILFSMAAEFQIHVLVWISTACCSLSHASIFAAGFAWIDRNLVKLDGKVTSVLMISAFMGGMVAPLPLGILMKEWSLMAFPYFVLLQAIISASIFYIAMFIVKPYINKTYGPLRSAHVDIVIKMQAANETMIQKESLVNENASNSIENNLSI